MPDRASELYTFIWKSCDRLRGGMGSWQFKNCVLVLFFIKYVSDQNTRRVDAPILIPEGGSFADMVALKGNGDIGNQMNKIIHSLADANPDTLKGVIDYVDFNDVNKLGRGKELVDRLSMLIDVFEHPGLDFRPDQSNASQNAVDIFSYLLDSFAKLDGYRGGEGYTPQDLLPLMVELLQPKGGKGLYDPAVGTGGMLVASDQFVKIKQNESSGELKLFGQDNSVDAVAISKMNLFLHGVFDAKIYLGDTIRDPKTIMDGELQKFDYVLSSPPFALQLSSHVIDEIHRDELHRFPYGVPNRLADYIFLQHILSSLNENGKAIVLIPGRMLFVTGLEGDIRKNFIENDLIEAVISLSPGLLTNTSAPIFLLILNKSKSLSRKGKILLINAAEEYERAGRGERFLTPEQRNRIVDSYNNFREIESYAALIDTSEVQRSGYNLMPSRYVELFPIEDFLGGKVVWERFDKIADIQRSSMRIVDSVGAEIETAPIIKVSDLSNAHVSTDDLERYGYRLSNDQSLYTQVGDILFSHIGGNKAIVVDQTLSGVLVGNHINVIRLKPEYNYLKQYVVEFLRSDKGHSLLSKYFVGGITPVLRLSDLRGIKIPIPEESVVQLLSSIQQVETNLVQRIEKARELRTKLFNITDADVIHRQLDELGTETKILSSGLIQADSLDYQIRNFYPYPLAFPYRSLSAIYDPVQKYPEQLRVAENLLVFLAALGLAVAQMNDGLKNQTDITSTVVKKFFGGGISPGDWQSLALFAGRAVRGQRRYAIGDSFASLWFKGSGSKETEFASDTKKLVVLKNDFKHDRGPKTPYDFQLASEEIQTIIDFCYTQLSFLVRYPIRFVQSMDIDYLTKVAVLETLVYEGDHPGLRREQVYHPTPLSKNMLYLEIDKDLWTPFYPHISVHYCPSCKMRETYFIDRWDNDNKAVLKSFERGHTHESDSDAKQVITNLEYWILKNLAN